MTLPTPAEHAAPGMDAARCDFCRRPIGTDDVSVTVYRDGMPRASYHEGCRPDRRRSGCSGSAC